MSELFPDPETPVTQTSAPSGICTLTLRRLLWRAPRISKCGVRSAECGVGGKFGVIGKFGVRSAEFGVGEELACRFCFVRRLEFFAGNAALRIPHSALPSLRTPH